MVGGAAAASPAGPAARQRPLLLYAATLSDASAAPFYDESASPRVVTETEN